MRTKREYKLLTCPGCGKPFGTYATRTYCSKKCIPHGSVVKVKRITMKEAWDSMKGAIKW